MNNAGGQVVAGTRVENQDLNLLRFLCFLWPTGFGVNRRWSLIDAKVLRQGIAIIAREATEGTEKGLSWGAAFAFLRVFHG